MNKKIISHGIMITAIVAFVFIAAALSSSNTHADTQKSSSVINMERSTDDKAEVTSGVKMIPDNEVPLAATPSMPGMNIPLAILILSAAAGITGVVIYEDVKDEYSM